MVEQVTLNYEIGAVGGLLVELPRTPDADILTAVTDVVRDVLEIAPNHGVVLGVVESVTDEGLEVVLSLEVAAFERVVTTVEEDPVVGGLKAGRIIIDDGGIADDPVVRIEGDHGTVSRPGSDGAVEKIKPVDHHIGSADIDLGRASEDGFAGHHGHDLDRPALRAVMRDAELDVVIAAGGQTDDIPADR